MLKRKTRDKKIITLSALSRIRREAGESKTVLVGGCFDLIHYGHLVFLEAAKQYGDILIVALEPDEFIKKHKRREPIHTQKQRAEILSHLDMVSRILMLPDLKGYEDYLSLVKQIQPSVIAVTEGDAHLFEKQKQAEAVKARLQIVCSVAPVHSTTNIIKYASIFSN